MYTFREKGNYHSSKAKKGAISSRTGKPLTDFARGRHSAFAQVNYSENRKYAHKKEAINRAKSLGYTSLRDFNKSPEGKSFQIEIRNRNLNYKRNRY